jgi:hypothetical protein
MTLADLLREHSDLFDEALDHKIRLVRTDHSIAAHTRYGISLAAYALYQRTEQNYLWNLAAEIDPRPIGIDYSLEAPNVGLLPLRADDSFIIWTSTVPIFIELYRQ